MCRAGRRRSLNRSVLCADARAGLDDSGVAELAATMDISNPRLLARGHRGVVFVADGVVIKRPRKESAEVSWLRRVNALGVGPRLLRAGDECFAMALADGEAIGVVLEGDDYHMVRRALSNLLMQCRALDAHGIDKGEMTCPRRHVVVDSNGNCTLLDFEGCRRRCEPQNVTQLCQYLSSSWVRTQLHRLGIAVDVAALRSRAAVYKRHQTDDNYEAILDALGLIQHR